MAVVVGGEIRRARELAKEGNVVGRAAEGGESGGGEAAVVVVGREPIARSVPIDKEPRTSPVRDPIPIHIQAAIDSGSGARDLRNGDVAAAGERDVAALEGVAGFEGGC